MKVNSIETHIFQSENTLNDIITCITTLPQNSIIAITAKIISICQKRFSKDDKLAAIKKEADVYLGSKTPIGVEMTIKNNIVIANAGIDYSNSPTGQMILWPEKLYETTQSLWKTLSKKFQHEQFGIIITDSRTSLMRKGTVGICIAFYGFEPIKTYTGSKDLFDRPFKHTEANLVDALAASAVFCMGEGAQHTPIALIENLNNLTFCKTTPEKFNSLQISLEDDIYLGSHNT